MRITQLKISNYKSLRSVEFVPTPLSVVVGANASGKSNLADCLDFISEVYRHGLEVAIARKGGYENIAFRKQRRSRQQIEIQLEVEFSTEDLRRVEFRNIKERERVRVNHSFAFVAQTRAIDAPFKVVEEELTIRELSDGKWSIIRAFERVDGEVAIKDPIEELPTEDTRQVGRGFDEWVVNSIGVLVLTQERVTIPPTDLFTTSLGQYISGVRRFVDAIGSIRVYQINPHNSRELGVPTPQPELDRYGSNLPAVIDRMRKDSPDEWAAVMESIPSVLPDLSSVEVNYSPSRQLALIFREEGFGRSWNVAEVSDGTIQTLALLVAIFKPGSLAVVLEEPENSIHPWIIRHIMDACRQASANKQIILTTHSPIVINSVRPEQVWVIWRENGESHLQQLPQLDQKFRALWEAGVVSAFEYVDSGALPQAIPPSPSDSHVLDKVS